MPDSAKLPEQKSGDIDQAVVSLMQSIGQSLNMAVLYGATHKVTRTALERSYPTVGKFLQEYDHIHFNLSDGSFLVNGVSTTGAPLAAAIASRLTGLNLLNFTLENGFTFEDYLAFFNLLMIPPSKLSAGKTCSELIESVGLKHVQATSFTYRRVAQNSDDSSSPSPEPDAKPPPPPVEEEPLPDVSNIMAFLKDDPEADSTRSAEDIRHLANDAEKLAELILRTIEIRASAANLAEGESLTDLVVGCIQKVVNQIVKDPAAKTQKGRKQVKRSLLMLEKALLERLQTLAGESTAKAAETLMDEVVEELDLDGLAGSFMKSQKASAKAREKLSRVIDRVADDPAQLEELHDRLTQEGLTPEEWQELTIRQERESDAGSGSGSGEGVNEIKLLTLLLAKLGETISQPPEALSAAPDSLKTLIGETEAHLAELTQITGKKIDSLQNKLTKEPSSRPLSRAEILRILAEIAQEISQPLTIINGTVTLIRSLRAGPITDNQGELLGMVSESGKRMEQLVSSLALMAGTPDSLHPDQNILSAAYRS